MLKRNTVVLASKLANINLSNLYAQQEKTFQLQGKFNKNGTRYRDGVSIFTTPHIHKMTPKIYFVVSIVSFWLLHLYMHVYTWWVRIEPKAVI